MPHQIFNIYPGKYREKIDRAVRLLEVQRIIERIKNIDFTIWKTDPAEISNRLGWLKSPETMLEALPGIRSFAEDISRSGISKVVLVGMGGSSLAPEVFSRTFEKKKGFPDLLVLDTTDPDAIHAIEKKISLKRSLILVATKSGGTVETISLMKYFYNRLVNAVGEEEVGSRFAAITDPESGLEKMARSLKFRKIFLNDPDIGGRYSALSYFGMVPAALIGVDIATILKRAKDFSERTFSSGDQAALHLGAMIGLLASEGRDKLTLIGDKTWQYFGPWVEQLVAESTGKEGKGILPVEGEGELQPEDYTPDRCFVVISETSGSMTGAGLRKAGYPVFDMLAGAKENIGIQFFLWEIATIVAGHFLHINPFDQPDVEAAKIKARELMDRYKKTGELEHPKIGYYDRNFDFYGDVTGSSVQDIIRKFFSKNRQKGAYLSIQAYLPPDRNIDLILQGLRAKLRNAFNCVTTVGYGPRFLHSTGQLHKGDGGRGIFLQILNMPSSDLEIPDEAGKRNSAITFGTLRNAQAFGDREALISAGRKVMTVVIKSDPVNLLLLV
jgi:transaldolase/glucose-6-phosphate isomerase